MVRDQSTKKFGLGLFQRAQSSSFSTSVSDRILRPVTGPRYEFEQVRVLTLSGRYSGDSGERKGPPRPSLTLEPLSHPCLLALAPSVAPASCSAQQTGRSPSAKPLRLRTLHSPTKLGSWRRGYVHHFQPSLCDAADIPPSPSAQPSRRDATQRTDGLLLPPTPSTQTHRTPCFVYSTLTLAARFSRSDPATSKQDTTSRHLSRCRSRKSSRRGTLVRANARLQSHSDSADRPIGIYGQW